MVAIVHNIAPSSPEPKPQAISSGEPVAALLSSVRDETHTIFDREEALFQLIRHGSPEALEALLTIVQDRKIPEELRKLAAYESGSYASYFEAAQDTLLDVARDATQPLQLREAALRGSGILGNVTFGHELSTLLTDRTLPPSLRNAIVSALGAIHYRDATQQLLEILKEPNLQPDLKDATLRALASFQDPRPEATAALIGALQDTSVSIETKQVVLTGLGRGGKDAEAVLWEIARSTEPDIIKATALKTLVQTNFVDGRETKTLSDLALSILHDRSTGSHQRVAALSILQTTLPQEQAHALFIELIHDSSEPPEVRAAALSSLPKTVICESEALLQDLLNNPSTSTKLTALIAHLAGTYQLQKLREPLYNRLAQSNDAGEHYTLTRALGLLGDNRVNEAFKKQVEESFLVSTLALEQIAARNAPDALATFRKILGGNLSTDQKFKAFDVLLDTPIPGVETLAQELARNPQESIAGSADALLASRGDTAAIDRVKMRLQSFHPLPILREEKVAEYRLLVKGLTVSSSPEAKEALQDILADTQNWEASTAARHVVDSVVNQSPERFNFFIANLRESGSDQLRHYADDLFRAKEEFGISHPFRYSPDGLKEILRNRENLRNNRDRSDRPTTVILVAQSDSNGFVGGVAELVDKARTQGNQVLVYEVGSDQDVVAALKEAARLGTSAQDPVENIVFVAHGDRTRIVLSAKNEQSASYGGIDFSDSGQLDISDSQELAEVKDSLAPGGRIVLASCTTGEGEDLHNIETNLVRFLRQNFPQAAPQGIFGSTNFTTFPRITYDEQGHINSVQYLYGTFRADANVEQEIGLFPS